MYESLASLIVRLASKHSIPLVEFDPAVKAVEDNCLDAVGIVGHKQVQPGGINGQCKGVTDSDKDGMIDSQPHMFAGKTGPGTLFSWTRLMNLVEARLDDLDNGPVLTTEDADDETLGVLVEATGEMA